MIAGGRGERWPEGGAIGGAGVEDGEEGVGAGIEIVAAMGGSKTATVRLSGVH